MDIEEFPCASIYVLELEILEYDASKFSFHFSSFHSTYS